jgi:hypothetical protein
VCWGACIPSWVWSDLFHPSLHKQLPRFIPLDLLRRLRLLPTTVTVGLHSLSRQQPPFMIHLPVIIAGAAASPSLAAQQDQKVLGIDEQFAQMVVGVGGIGQRRRRNEIGWFVAAGERRV